MRTTPINFFILVLRQESTQNREQMNALSHYLDSSNVYGSHFVENMALREFRV